MKISKKEIKFNDNEVKTLKDSYTLIQRLLKLMEADWHLARYRVNDNKSDENTWNYLELLDVSDLMKALSIQKQLFIDRE